MTRLAAALLGLLAAGSALAQTYPGQFPANTVYGNATGSTAAPTPGQVINAQLASMAASTIKCNPTSGSGAPQDCNAVGLVGSQSIAALASTNGTYAGSNTGAVNWCPGWPGGCSNGTAGGTWTAQQALIATTAGPPSQQESSLMSVLFVNTGFAAVWKPSTAYASGNYAVNGPNLYLEITGTCISAGSGGPTGTGSGIVDGTCTWNYQAPSFAAGKQAGNFNTIAQAGAGHVWGLTSASTLQAGWNSQFAAGAEIDLYNSSSVSSTFGGGNNLVALYLGGLNANPITASLYISPNTSSANPAAQYGIILNGGANTFSSGNILNNVAGSTVGYVDQGSHTSSSINDASTSPIGINLTGTYSGTAINIAPTSGANAIEMTGGKNVCWNGSANCSSWNSGLGAVQFTGLAVNPGSGNANLYFVAGSQQWLATANSSNSSWSLFDSTNSKTPFSIAANTPNNMLQVTANGVILSPGFTVATLPACGAGQTGARAYITDGNTATPTFLGALTGGGTNKAPVFCNGSAWVYG